MSKNVKILENAVEKILPEVGKIQTQLTNGNKCYWVPEDEIPLGTLTVTQDGVYKASEDPNGPYYGYSQVTASGIGNVEMGNLTELVVTENGVYKASLEEGGPFVGYSKVTVNVPQDGSYHPSSGTVGKDDDGDDAIATVDPETGEIKIDKLENGLPVRIEITTPPDYVGPYGNGAYISFEGLVVTAYCENDIPFDTSTTPNGVIPIEQLEFPVTVADYYQSTDMYGIKTLDNKSVVAAYSVNVLQNWWDGLQGEWVKNRSVHITCSGGVLIIKANRKYTDYHLYPYAVSDTNGASVNYKYSDDGLYRYSEDLRGKNGFVSLEEEIGLSDITGHMMYGAALPGYDWRGDGEYQRVDSPEIPLSEYTLQESADIVLHGAGTMDGGQIIPVMWNAPGTNTFLETTFNIVVLPPPSGTND